MQTLLIVVSSVLALVSPLIYIRSIVAGETRPHRTTRFVLLIINLLSFSALLASHNTVAVWLAAAAALQAIPIFLLSIKRGMGGWSLSDILCLIIALAGIVAWQTTNDPLLGLYFALSADFVGMIPALIKTYRLPYTESPWFYGLDAVAALCTIFAVTAFSTAELAYPSYILLINVVMVFLILRPRTGNDALQL